MFKDKLKELRRQKGVTQEQLAKVIGVERSAVGQYEGKRAVIPSDPVKMKIAEFFGVTVDYLLDENATPITGDNYGFPERLAEMRKNRGYTQQELAVSLGLSKNTIYSYEKGIREPDLKTLADISKFFGTTADYLIGLSDDPTTKETPPALAEGAVRKTITLEGGLPSDAEWLREFVQSEIQKAIQGDSQS